ncbi:unnamed protein product [Tetraodon nigroviridis]|uniref:(spotted green pufferfish) hypothetical protein n=1 Tax=Tetraodon nigroviridis TaxID=99883 RepID=Q4RUW1_TETNG|nr:unnamed protein product [Tetraodon nigroviridis]
MSLRTLLELCLLLGPGALCLVPVWRLPKPHVIDVEALSAKRTLLVSWLANRTSLLGATCELQIGRTENRTIVFSANITVCSLGKKVWTWTSDLPLECVDHSVRMRYLYNQTVPSPWSNWKNNSGAQPADKTKMFPFQQVLREGDRAMFCCVPPRGVPITGMTLNDRKYPLIHVTAAVRAISVENLTWDPGRRRDPYDRNEQTHTLHVHIPGDRDPCALQWVKVPAGTNMLSLPAGNFKAGCRFTFIIYGCTESGHRLLEIQTGYTQELQSVEAPNLGTFTSDSSSVTLEWHYNEDDEAHPAFITGYLVTVQEVQQNTLNLLNVSVSDPRRKSVTVDGLQPNRDYVLSVSALTRQGPGLATSITIRTRPSYSAHLVKILTPVLLLLFCALLLWPRRNVVKTRLVGIFAYPAGMNVRAPDLDSVLQEMVKRLQSEEVEECRECHIEILDTGALLEATSEADALTRLAPGSSRPEEPPPTQVPIQVDYCPQSAPLPLQAPPASH